MRYLNYDEVVYNEKGRKSCPYCKGPVKQVRRRKRNTERVLYCWSCRQPLREKIKQPLEPGPLDEYLEKKEIDP